MPRASVPKLSNIDLLRIECLARRGPSWNTIATLEGLSLAQSAMLLETDPRLCEVIDYGRATGIRDAADALLEAATKGGDVSVAKFWLERVAGGSWSPPRAAPPTITVHASTPLSAEKMQRMQNDMEARFERQRRLIDGTAEELRDHNE
jgi:hypothetical protein